MGQVPSTELVPVREGEEIVFYTPQASGAKRKRVYFDATANPGTADRRRVKAARRANATVRRTSRKGGPTLKQRLLRDLRAQKKKLKAELKQVERDYNSLICKRKKKAE